MNTQDFCFILKQNSHLLREGCFGLEKENVRVNQDGTLALTPHPAVFGDKGKHPYITTDFSESQVEMITPPLPSVGEALGFMETLHDVVTENIGDELLWPQSLPPVLKENQEIPLHIIRESSRTRSITVRNLPEPTERKGSLFREYTSISLSRKN